MLPVRHYVRLSNVQKGDFVLRSVGFVFGLALVSAPLTATAGTPSTLTPLTETETRTLLTDVETGPECCDNSEAFYADGTYVHLGIAADPGHYTISGNRVCVTTEYQPQAMCRRVYRDATGQAVFVRDGSGSAYPIDPRPAPDRSYWD